MRAGKISILKKEDLQNIINNNVSFSNVLRYLNLDTSSGNFRSLKRKLKFENINFDHLKRGPNYMPSKMNLFKKKTPLTEILTENSTYNTSFLKKRLIKEGIFVEKCSKCDMGPIWNDEPLSLQLDHINGISDDNRLENLRLLCPNCHSQTSNYAGKSNKKMKLKKQRPTKIEWPSDSDLTNMIKQSGYVQIGKLLGVSDNAIRKRLARGKPVGN